MAIAVTAQDEVLITEARRVIIARYRAEWHVVGAALRTRSGRVFTGVHLEANVGRIAVCAEAVALGRAATEAGDTDIDTIVAVYHAGGVPSESAVAVVAPCGMCRELIADYAPDAHVLMPRANGEVEKVPVSSLLPGKYRRP